MKDEHRKEWNRRYREGGHHTEEASPSSGGIGSPAYPPEKLSIQAVGQVEVHSFSPEEATAEGVESYEDGERSAIARMVCRKSSDFEKDLPSISDFLASLGSSVERLF